MSAEQLGALAAESKAPKEDPLKEELRVIHYARRLYHSRDRQTRIEAMDELARMGTPASLHAIAGALGYGDDVSDIAASVLLSYKNDALFALRSVLEEGTDGGKAHAVSILVQIGSQGAFDTLARALLDDEYGIAGEAAFHLLLAQGTGKADTQNHFYSIPEGKSLSLLGSMLSGIHPASDLQSVVLRAESAAVLANLLEAKPWLASEVKSDAWMPAIDEWTKAGAEKSFAAIARALHSADEKVSSEAAFQLLLASGRGKAETHSHFHRMPGEKAVSLIEKMLSGAHTAPREEAALVRAGASRVFSDILLAKPGLGLVVGPDAWMSAISEWSAEGTEKSYAATAVALTSTGEAVSSEAAFQLLLANAAGKADTSPHFDALKDEKAFPLLRKMLDGVRYKPEDDARAVRLQSAKLLDSFAKAGRAPSQAYPLLASVLGDKDQVLAKFAFDSLHIAGFPAIPHMEIQLFTGSDAAVERAAQLFLTVKGAEDETYYAYSKLLSAGFEKRQVMELLENRGSFDIFCSVLNDKTADAKARKSAAILVNREDAATALPLLLDACLDTMQVEDNDHREIRDTIVSLLKARTREPEAEVPILLGYYSLSPKLQPTVFELLSACEPAKAIPAALHESRKAERNYDYDIAIKQLIQEAYGLGCMPCIADYASSEYPKVLSSGDKASISAAAEEARFLISIFPSEFSREHAVRFLKASLPLLEHMNDGQKTAVCNFARKLESDALPLILEYARAEVKAGRRLGNETIGMLLTVVDHIGEKEGIEFFGYVLPEAAGMDNELLGALRDMGAKLDPVRAESIILDYVNEMASSGRLSKADILALVAIEDKIAPKALEASGSKYCAGAELLSYALPVLNSMGQEERQAVGHFAMRLKASALPFVLGYAESEIKAGRRLGAENALLISAVVDYIGEKEGIEFLGYILPEIAGIDSQKMNSIKVLVDLDRARAERLVLDYAGMRFSAGQLSRDETLALLEIAAEIARLAALSSDKTSCAEFFRYVIPWLPELSGEQFEMARSVLRLDAAAAERALLDYASAKASESTLSKDELFSLMIMEHELAEAVASSKGSPSGASLLEVALPMLKDMDAQEALSLVHFVSSKNIRESAAAPIAAHIKKLEERATIAKEEFAALALMLARINTDEPEKPGEPKKPEGSFQVLTKLFKDENTEVGRAMQEALTANYDTVSEDGEKPVRETILRAALGRKIEGRKERDMSEGLSTFGTVAFEVIGSQKDAASDVIIGCRDAHICTQDDAVRTERRIHAMDLLIQIGDPALRDLSEGVFSEDLSRYQDFCKANLLETIARMAKNSKDPRAKELAKECLLKAVGYEKLGVNVVGDAIGKSEIEVVKELTTLLLPDPAGSTDEAKEKRADMEKRALGILLAIGPKVHAEIGQMLASKDATQQAYAALAVKKLLSCEKKPADALKKNPQFQANLDSLVSLLVYPDENVREASAQALRKFWAFVSLEEVVKATSQIISSEDEYFRAQGAVLVSSTIAREANPAETLQKCPQLQACVDALPAMLVDSSKIVRDTAEDALKRVGRYVSPSEFEKVIRFKKEEPKMLLLQDEVSQRRKAAALLAMAGEPAIDHFLSTIRDDSLDRETVKRCIAASVSIGERMLEKLVDETAHRSVSDKFYLLERVADSKTPLGKLLKALSEHSAVWHNLLEPAGIQEGAHIPAWESKLLQWFVVSGTVLDKDEFAADMAYGFISSLKLFSAADMAADFRETLDAKIKLRGLFGAKDVEGETAEGEDKAEEEKRIALSNIDLLEKRGIDTTEIRNAITRKPGPISEEREKYAGFLKQDKRKHAARKHPEVKPPPLPRRNGPGGRKLVGPTGGNGGPAGGRF